MAGDGGARAAAAASAPLLLVRHARGSNCFEACPDALAALRAMGPGPAAAVAVCGRARTGKSLLLNQLAAAAAAGEGGGGFAVGSTQRACTHGIWMWSPPPAVPGKDERIVYLDCEGTDAAVTDGGHGNSGGGGGGKGARREKKKKSQPRFARLDAENLTIGESLLLPGHVVAGVPVFWVVARGTEYYARWRREAPILEAR